MLEGKLCNLGARGISAFVFYFLKGAVSDVIAVSLTKTCPQRANLKADDE